MKLKLFTIPCSMLLTITLFFAACTKEGPAGPAGPAGAQGPAGPTGTQGPKGDTGTANVIYSSWLDVAYEADTVHNGTTIDTLDFVGTINAPQLSDSVINTGEIKVYWNLGSADEPNIVPLPYFDIVIFGGLSINPYFSRQNITLISNANVSSRSNAGAKVFQYRYILVPGGVPGGRLAKVNWNNYKEVKQFLGLKD